MESTNYSLPSSGNYCESKKIEGSSVKNYRTKTANRRKKQSIYSRLGVDGLKAHNTKKWEARERSRTMRSQSFIRCAFECEGIRKGLVANGKISLFEGKTDNYAKAVTRDNLEEAVEENVLRAPFVGTSTFNVDKDDEERQSS